MSTTRRIAGATALVLVAAACGLAGGSRGAGRSSAPAASRAGAPPCSGRAHGAAGGWRVIVVVLENHTFRQVAGSSPYLNRLARECALATDYRAVAHPSLPNYLALTSGGTDGIAGDCTGCSTRARSIFEQLHGDWRSYLESMPSVGYRGASAGRYAKKHNPAAYYVRIASSYAHDAVPLGSRSNGSLARDLRNDALRRYSLIVPDLCHDEHDCPVSVGDRWLRDWIPLVLGSRAYRSGNVALFVTYDEAADTDEPVYTVVAARSIRPGTVVRTRLDHYSLLRTGEQLLGLPCLARACGSASMLSWLK